MFVDLCCEGYQCTLYVDGSLHFAAENVSSVYLSVGGAANRTRMQRGVLRLTATVGVGLTCKVVGGMPPPRVDVFLNGINITDQVPHAFSSTIVRTAQI